MCGGYTYVCAFPKEQSPHAIQTFTATDCHPISLAHIQMTYTTLFSPVLRVRPLYTRRLTHYIHMPRGFDTNVWRSPLSGAGLSVFAHYCQCAACRPIDWREHLPPTNISKGITQLFELLGTESPPQWCWRCRLHSTTALRIVWVCLNAIHIGVIDRHDTLSKRIRKCTIRVVKSNAFTVLCHIAIFK